MSTDKAYLLVNDIETDETCIIMKEIIALSNRQSVETMRDTQINK